MGSIDYLCTEYSKQLKEQLIDDPECVQKNIERRQLNFQLQTSGLELALKHFPYLFIRQTYVSSNNNIVDPLADLVVFKQYTKFFVESGHVKRYRTTVLTFLSEASTNPEKLSKSLGWLLDLQQFWPLF